jgi:hypothetical protein
MGRASGRTSSSPRSTVPTKLPDGESHAQPDRAAEHEEAPASEERLLVEGEQYAIFARRNGVVTT